MARVKPLERSELAKRYGPRILPHYLAVLQELAAQAKGIRGPLGDRSL